MELLWNKLVPNLSGNKGQGDSRTQYEKDYDRVVFLQGFRRLAGKTQVHPFSHNDHIHTRLSHSLEVSIVGRSIVKKLFEMKVIQDVNQEDCVNIVMTAGIGHDMGNPPLGHVGEDAIGKWIVSHGADLKGLGISNDYVETYSSYDGNAQNFHLFNTQEYLNEKKLNKATLASFVKYPWASSKEKHKSGYFIEDKDLFQKCFESLGLKNEDEGEFNGKYARHPLSYVMEAADDICYSLMDIDDAHEMGYKCTDTKIKDLVKTIFSDYNEDEDAFAFLREKRGDVIEKAVDAVAKSFSDNKDYIMHGNVATSAYDPDKNKDLLKMGKSSEILQLIDLLKSFAANNIFKQRDKVVYETACYSIIHSIFDAWLKAYEEFKGEECGCKYDKLSVQSKKVFELMNMSKQVKEGDKALVQIVDYVSGMTDRYAKFVADTLTGRVAI